MSDKDIKVMHVGKYFPPRYGGIESFMSQLMEEQQKHGMKVSAIVHQDYQSFSKKISKWMKCQIYHAKSYGQLLYAPVSPMFPFLLFEALRAEKPDVIHFHVPNLSALWLLLFQFRKPQGTKWVVHWHSDIVGEQAGFWIKALYPLYRIFESQLLKKADSVIATSAAYLDTSSALKPYINKVSVIPLGIANHRYAMPIKKREEILKLLIIGRLTYYKGHRLLLEAVSKLLTDGVAVELNIIGEGELEEELVEQCHQANIESSVIFHGSLNEKGKYSLMQECDLLCLTSIERTEAFGVVLLEAASVAVPSLVSDVIGSGMSYVVQDNKTGLVCKRNSVPSIIEKLSWAAENTNMLVSYGDCAKERLLKHFLIDVVERKIAQLYK